MKIPLFFLLNIFLIKTLAGQWSFSVLENKSTIRSIDASDIKNIWISGSNGSIFNSKDEGLTWQNRCPEAYQNLDFRGVSVLGEKTVLAMSSGDGAEGKALVIKTTDGGKTWAKVYADTTKGAFFDTIKFTSPWTGYLLGDPIDEYPYLMVTNDVGEHWRRVENLPPIIVGEASFAASNSCISTLGNNVWFNTQNRVFNSFDAGKTWQIYNTLFMKGETQGIFGLFAIDKYTLILAGGDYKDNEEPTLQYSLSVSGGQSWYTQKDYWARGVTECVDDFGQKRYLISVGTAGTSISKDSGLSWSKIDNEPFHVVKCFGNTCLAAGSEGKVGKASF